MPKNGVRAAPMVANAVGLPGLTAIMLLNVTTFLTAFSIVREKERGTLEQLFVTPVKPYGLPEWLRLRLARVSWPP